MEVVGIRNLFSICSGIGQKNTMVILSATKDLFATLQPR